MLRDSIIHAIRSILVRTIRKFRRWKRRKNRHRPYTIHRDFDPVRMSSPVTSRPFIFDCAYVLKPVKWSSDARVRVKGIFVVYHQSKFGFAIGSDRRLETPTNVQFLGFESYIGASRDLRGTTLTKRLTAGRATSWSRYMTTASDLCPFGWKLATDPSSYYLPGCVDTRAHVHKSYRCWSATVVRTTVAVCLDGRGNDFVLLAACAPATWPDQ